MASADRRRLISGWRLLARLRAFGPPLVARVFGLLVQTVVGWLALHYASAADLGVYYIFVAWATTLGWVTGFGLGEQVLRTVSVALAEENPTKATELGLAAIAFAGLSGAVSFVMLEAAFQLPGALAAVSPDLGRLLWSPDIVPPPLLTALGVVALLGSRAGAQLLKAFRRPTLGIYAEYMFPFLPLMVGAVILAHTGRLTGRTLILLQIAGGLMTMVAIALAFFAGIGGAARGTIRGVVASSRHLGDRAGAQWLAVGLQSVLNNLPLIAVSIVAGNASAGIFGLCTRLASITGISSDVIIAMRGPVFAEHHSRNDKVALARALRSSRRATITISLPIFVAVGLLATEIIRFFGVQDVEFAREILLVLLIGRLIFVLVGPVSYFLWMIGAFREEIIATAAALVTLIVGVVAVLLTGLEEPVLAVAIVTSASLAFRFLLQFGIASRKTALTS